MTRIKENKTDNESETCILNLESASAIPKCPKSKTCQNDLGLCWARVCAEGWYASSTASPCRFGVARLELLQLKACKFRVLISRLFLWHEIDAKGALLLLTNARKWTGRGPDTFVQMQFYRLAFLSAANLI